METGGIGAAPAVRHRAVAQANFRDGAGVSQPLPHASPESQRVGRAVTGGMERQQLWVFRFRRGEAQKPLRQIPDGQTICLLQRAARVFGLHGKV
ncbi:hypothetical protein SDC9_132106 [bioreactor metagenome]|uniref:Uncharacterized protein n=1 Tax=bioreactor metagenome TaxID=1076179 RepID=A0A645D727_9ZZZZ